MRQVLPSSATFRWIGLCALTVIGLTWSATAQNAPADSIPQTIKFNRDIRPILSDKCFKCHGPDSTSRRAALRLDDEAAAKVKAIVAGDPEHSLVVQRITSTDARRRMPFQAEALSDREVKLISRWIEQGAKYDPFWSFIAPVRAELPKVKDTAWPKNAIDYFVLDRLEKEGLKPAPEADRATRLRRVTLDLIGLPPTPAELAAFVDDKSPNAYEQVVDRLLASPRYGERMAASWMAASRFADTIGYAGDYARDMHRWRDWVIDAYNRHMPFDQFTIEQLAGDLLPNATPEQRIATAFNRNHRMMAEAGALPDEFFVEQVLDRVTTFSTVWLGLTPGCARCHDHKFDPLKQKETYQLFAFFNNNTESGVGQKGGNTPPVMLAPTRDQAAKLKELDDKTAKAEKAFADLKPEIEAAQREWEKSLGDAMLISGALNTEHLVGYFPLPGEAEHRFDGVHFVDAGTARRLGPDHALTIAAWIEPTTPNGPIVTRTGMTPKETGLSFMLKDGVLQLNLVTLLWMDEAIHAETAEPVVLNGRHHVAVTYDGSYMIEGVHFYVDGIERKLKKVFNNVGKLPLEGASDPLRIGAGGGPEKFRGTIMDVRIYDAPITPEQVSALAEPTSINDIARIAPDARTKSQAAKIDAYFLDNEANGRVEGARLTRQQLQGDADGETRRQRPLTVEGARAAIRVAKREKADYVKTVPTVMVMQELPEPRDAFVLNRGEWNKPGDKVERNTPAFLPPMPPNAPKNRLGLAMWVMDPANPLTARVAVNRYWEMFFGTGLVKTVDNFGSQGEQPSHPELIDWLATEFVRVKWNVQAMQKLIVMSATYQQSSRTTPELMEKDPENRLLAHGPRYRLPGEMVRDQALAIAGLLSGKIGGPSVKPYQPEGMWDGTSNEKYVQSHGEDLYRRSLYTFWRRSTPPPTLAMFDVADRDNPAVGTSRTDTPLQALTVLNDVTYLEASRKLAERMLTEAGRTDRERIFYAVRLSTAKDPSEIQFKELLKALNEFRAMFRTDREGALKLVSQGESPRNQKLDVTELAAYAVVARLVLNFDEVLTKQ